jgi:adenylosuccinate synthase
MALDIVVGAQWGDEGKGRMVDMMASESDYVARFSGGDNAGHTVTVGDHVYKLHLIPSGIVHPHTVCVLGNGMVINPATLLGEIDYVRESGVEISPQRLRISYGAHLITPAHIALDEAQESSRGDSQIGTTKRGIGPAYVSKTARHGLRVGDMLDEEVFADAVHEHVISVNKQLTYLHGAETINPQDVAAQYVDYARRLQPYIDDVSSLLTTALSEGKHVLAEGAQGTLLDLDFGTYPFVTSSNPSAPGALTGLGIGLVEIDRVVGVAKAFQTRVGEGPFPTELYGDVEEHLRGTGTNPWDEFGTTTGRPRRVGWLDTVLLRYAVRVNGFNQLALTKMDILTGIDALNLCVAYRENDQRRPDLPYGPYNLDRFDPVYEEIPGWDQDIQDARKWDDLPIEAQFYIQRIEALVGVPVRWVSVGPEREQVVSIH